MATTNLPQKESYPPQKISKSCTQSYWQPCLYLRILFNLKKISYVVYLQILNDPYVWILLRQKSISWVFLSKENVISYLWLSKTMYTYLSISIWHESSLKSLFSLWLQFLVIFYIFSGNHILPIFLSKSCVSKNLTFPNLLSFSKMCIPKNPTFPNLPSISKLCIA